MSDRVQELQDWWAKVAAEDAARTIPKVIEYGSADLKVMGAALQAMIPRGEELPARVGQEAAVAFYLLGKVARMFGAYAQGQAPTDDTWLDARIYAMMGHRIRERGEWG